MSSRNTILFDMDGTLFDTEKYYQKAWNQAIRDMGYHIPPSEVLKLRSLGRPFCIRKFEEWFKDADAYQRCRSRRCELMRDFLADEVPLKPGVPDTLKVLQESGLRLAVVTATAKDQAEQNLSLAGIRAYFETVVCAAMVKMGKPAPDVYQYACRMLDVNPKDCYAVEDSPNGVRSAHDAGCAVIMIPDLTEPDEETAELLHCKIARFPELADFFQKEGCLKKEIQLPGGMRV